MLTRAQNETLTRTGPGTPMGDLFRRFWQPALLSRDLAEADGAPVRVNLLGESLVAFRDTSGRVGLVEARCPHRGADLFFGRNEDCGLRCVYTRAGSSTWTASALRSRPCRRTPWPMNRCGRGRGSPPIRRANGAGTSGPTSARRRPCRRCRKWSSPWSIPAHRYVSRKLQECNWAQSAEGAVGHGPYFSFLHAPIGEAALSALPRGYQEQTRWMSADAAPRYTVAPHGAGLVMAGARHADGEDTYWRIAQYMMPNHSLAPGGAAGQTLHGQTWVPIDDESCWVYTCNWSPDRPRAARRSGRLDGWRWRPLRRWTSTMCRCAGAPTTSP